jgi:DNA polymerase-1
LGPFSFFEQVNGSGYKISYEEAKGLFQKYETNFKEGIRFLRDAGRSALQQGYLANISGRRRYWIRPDEEDKVKYPQGRYDKAYMGRRAGIEREGGNFLIQSVNADMTKSAMVLIRDYIKKNNIRSRFMNQVYDEIVTRTHKDDSPDFVKVKRKLMLEAAEQYLKKIPMEVDGHVGDSWTK